MTPKDWAAENIRFHHIPIEDFTGYLPTMDLSGMNGTLCFFGLLAEFQGLIGST
jgi:hypothetical protein